MNKYVYAVVDSNGKIASHHTSLENAREMRIAWEVDPYLQKEMGEVPPYKIVRYSNPEVIR